MTYRDALDISYDMDATTEQATAALHLISGEPRTLRNVGAMNALIDQLAYLASI